MARGSSKQPLKEEKKTIAFAFPSVVALENLDVGSKLSKKNIFLKRPGGGDFGINDLEKLYGKTVIKKIKKNTQIKKIYQVKKIIFVTASRADYGKLKNLIINLQKNKNYKVYVFVTGMHNLKKFGSTWMKIKLKSMIISKML